MKEKDKKKPDGVRGYFQKDMVLNLRPDYSVINGLNCFKKYFP